MIHWFLFHLDDSIKAMATYDQHRFFVRVREPIGEARGPIAFYRQTIDEAQESADQVVQEYYPHECSPHECSAWTKDSE
jgi:hypothetical protein